METPRRRREAALRGIRPAATLRRLPFVRLPPRHHAMPTLGLVLLFATLATVAVAGPVRVEFTATLTKGTLVGAPSSLSGFYEINDEQVMELLDDRFGVVRTRQITGFGLTGFGSTIETGTSGHSAILTHYLVESPPPAFRIPWINYSVDSLDASSASWWADLLVDEQLRNDPNEALLQYQLTSVLSELGAIGSGLQVLHAAGNCPAACEQSMKVVSHAKATATAMQSLLLAAIESHPQGQLAYGGLGIQPLRLFMTVESLNEALITTPPTIVGPSLSVADEDRLADDIDVNGSGGTMRVLADLNGDGVIESHEVIAFLDGYGDFNSVNPLREELTLSFRPFGAALPSETALAPALSLDEVAAAVLRVTYREDSTTLRRLGFPSLVNQMGELEYTITSLNVVPEPCSLQLLAAMLLAAGRRRQPR